ncbi:hypothetical protein AGMMS50276_00260 [Synergistales bacterium]|nr:hypothetical protein AGMMS50276_00260 [Synergistales bacterium]
MTSEDKKAREGILSFISNMLSEIFKSHGFSESVLRADCQMLGYTPRTNGQERLICEVTLSGKAIESALSNYKGSVGKNRQDLIDKLWKRDSKSFLWLLPKGLEKEATENVDFTDNNGQKWISPLLILPPEREKSEEKSKKRESLLKMPANIDDWRVISAFWRRVEFSWGRFCGAVSTTEEDKNKKDKEVSLTYKALITLEASLNAPWSGSAKANKGMLRDLSDHGDTNQLLLIETKRAVNIAYKPKQAGRVRLPHLSHRSRLCPYQTPESKEIGLHLFRSAGSVYSPSEKKIEPGKYLVSLAVGLIPYIEHSDGPRLLMGGKNLKQAEHGIKALRGKDSPKALVPGYLESEIENDETLGVENHRFKYTLGLDALVAIMPYKGFTYEDGLVVSRSFADKLSIPEGRRVQTEVLKFDLPKGETMPTEQELENEINESGVGGSYSLGEALPLPLLIEVRKICDREKIPTPRYDYRYKGMLESCKVRVVEGRKRSGSDEKKLKKSGLVKEASELDGGGTLIQLKIRYEFRVNRPLAIGDKLTGRHGNKGVVTHILEEPAKVIVGGKETPIDLMISPGALMGRKNLGQLYEMTHSLLLWGKEVGVFNDANYDEWRDILRDVDKNKLLSHDKLSKLLPVVKEMAGDERGAFQILLPNGEGECRAFVGFQHIARLHHHVKAKLQYRQTEGPFNSLLGQPGSGGASAGQRLGEMENWSCLSHPIAGEKDSFDLLFSMRKEHGDASVTRNMARSVLWSLGYHMGENAEIERSCEIKAKEAFGSTVPRESDLFYVMNEVREYRKDEMSSAPRFAIKAERVLAYSLGDSSVDLGELLNDAISKLGDLAAKTEEKLRSFFVFDTVFENGKVFLPVAIDVLLQHKKAGDAFLEMVDKFSLFSRYPKEDNAAALLGGKRNGKSVKGAIFEYQVALLDLLKGKMGLLRRHLLGRRLDNSARGVIVPCPDLEIDIARLPKNLLLGILTDETRERLEKKCLKKETSLGRISSDELNKILKICPVWVILIRQPSLHRHNFTAFRASCWDKDDENNEVIGIPPFVTPGYNADFDGDTMAVFLPPEPYASDLSHMSLLSNPGLVGTGKLALADGLDLALGWMNIYKENKPKYDKWLENSGVSAKPEGEAVSLSDVMTGLFRKLPSHDLLAAIRELQEDVCAASTGAATMTPVEFETLYRQTRGRVEAEDFAFDKECEKETEGFLKKWVKENHDKNNLADFVHYKVKGGVKELRVMGAFVGEQKDYDDYEEDRDMSEKTEIKRSFWEGLDDDEMFRYSYATRNAMASKKLDVAQAGYLSYLLAEGLYDTTITEKRCGGKSGMKISWDNNEKTLFLDVGGRKIKFPANKDNLHESLGRIAWGREPLGKPDRLLTSDNIKDIAAFWTEDKPIPKDSEGILDGEGVLCLRSPLTCESKEERGVCAACAGADPSSMPYDKPSLTQVGSRVGLTAAQAIGERGTQLAMKRFHDTSSKKTPIDSLKLLLIQGRGIEGEDCTSIERFEQLIGKILTEKGEISKELPQQLIHFELSLMAPRGLGAWSREVEGRWLSAFAYGGMAALEDIEGKYIEESWSSPKSRLMWDTRDGGMDA